MNTRRFLCISLFLMAGCANHLSSKPSVVASKATKPAAKPVSAPVDEPKWEAAAGPTASELLATQAADFARRLHTPDTTPMDDPQQNPADRRTSLAGPKTPKAVASAGDTATPTGPLASTDGAVPASLSLSALPKAQGDDPHFAPESADFQTTTIAKPAHGDELGDRLRKRVEQNPRDIASQLDLQLFQMLNDEPMSDRAAVSALSSEDQELIYTLIDGVGGFRDLVRQNGNLLTGPKLKPLMEMIDRLRTQAGLSVSTVALCSKVDGFGKYTPISPPRFIAGSDKNAAIVYCEVENILTRQSSGQMWETRLSEQVTLFTDQGMMVWSAPVREVTDECRNRRHDFFAYNVIHLPPNLTIGRYLLKLSIEDKNAHHIAEATVPLSIAAE